MFLLLQFREALYLCSSSSFEVVTKKYCHFQNRFENATNPPKANVANINQKVLAYPI